MRRMVKLLHELGTVGVAGAAIAQLVLAAQGADLPPAEHALVRRIILQLDHALLLPSLALVLLSGVTALMVHKPFLKASWVWAKILLSVGVLEGTLLAAEGPARAAVRLAEEVAAGKPKEGALRQALSQERAGVGVVLALYGAQIALGVFRPRLSSRSAAPPEAPEPA